MTAPPARTPSPDDADWYRYIGRQWQRIQGCMQDERISAMYHALVAQLEYPTDPDAPGFSRAKHNQQSGAMRMALIGEIDALGIEPRPPKGVGDA